MALPEGTMNEIEQWLSDIGLDQYGPLFRAQEIDLNVLPDLRDGDLKELGIPLGHRKRLLRAIDEIQARDAAARDPVTAVTGNSAPNAAAEGERRQLTVMFCDIVGSTPLAQRLDPEDMRQVIRNFQDRCTEAVSHFDGFVAHYMGDGLLAYFGYPRAHEDDAERAIRAAMRIVERIAGPAVGDEPIQVRVGIATGLVVVGDIVGSGSAQQEAVTGNTPNLAARLQAQAQPNMILISATTRQLAGGAFLYDDMGLVNLKGLDHPERIWRVLEEARLPSRFEAARSEGLTPLVGREHEIGVLLDRWQMANEGEGQAVLLSAEPGIGKSRIALAVRDRIAHQRHTLIQCQCSPYHTNSVLHPILGFLERAAGFAQDDSVNDKLRKLEELCAESSSSPMEASELLGAALLLPLGERSPAARMSAQRQKEETIKLLASLVVFPSANAPVLLMVEDAHWADPTTLAVLDLVMERIRAARVLVLLTFRPEFESRWAGYTYVTIVALNRLSRNQSVAVVRRVAQGVTLPDELIDRIVDKTDGIPLFVEELTKAVLESAVSPEGADVAVPGQPLVSMDIPATLRDSLMARLDRLGRGKDVAQIGSVFGREFEYRLIATVTQLPDAVLTAALAQLTSAGLVYCRGQPPEATYAFKHALIQDAAYESLLKTRRQQLHASAAEAIERNFRELGSTQPELVARHYTLGALPERAIPYWLRAGEQARDRSANAEALVHFNKGLELVRQLPSTEPAIRSEIQLLTSLGPVVQATTGLASRQCEELYNRARDLCEKVGDSAQLFIVLVNLWLLTTQRGKLDSALRLSSQLLSTATERAEPDLVMQAHHSGWATYFFRGEFAETLAAVEGGCALYHPERHATHKFIYTGHDPIPCGMVFKGLASWFRGDYAAAAAGCAASVQHARALEHPFTIAIVSAYANRIHYLEDQPDLLAGSAEELIELCEREHFPNWLAFGSIQRGYGLAQKGDADGLKLVESGIALQQRTGSTLNLPFHKCLLAQAQWRLERKHDALNTLADAIILSDDHQEGWSEAELHRVNGEFLRQMGRDFADRAEEALLRALDVSRRQQAKAMELRAATSLARLWRDTNRRDAARELLPRSLAFCRADEQANDVRQARDLLQELSL
jgi:class 3 adenylate cyclase/predicted ATPase